MTDEKFKLVAGWLIYKAGWKGYCKGNVGVHPLQGLTPVIMVIQRGRGYDNIQKLFNSVFTSSLV